MSTNQLNQLNSLIQQASETIMCDSECQTNKRNDSLRQRFLNAQTNLASAPNRLQVAERNYVTVTQGEQAYEDLLEQQLGNQANLIAETFQENFVNEIRQFNIKLNSYSGILIHFQNIVDLFLNYRKENIELFKQLKENTNDVLTNQRKTYYEDQQIDNLKFYYYYFLFTVYVIVVICFIIFSLIYPSDTSFMMRIIILIGFIILPFIASYIFAGIIFILYKIYEILPKNVYKK
jgi:hypothetical protein